MARPRDPHGHRDRQRPAALHVRVRRLLRPDPAAVRSARRRMERGDPRARATTGVAFHHDRPNAEPPQAWLLVLPAVFDGSWSWDDLVGAVTDALDSAKLRAIEPTHLDTTAYDALLPATHSAWTFPEISISNNLQRNVRMSRGWTRPLRRRRSSRGATSRPSSRPRSCSTGCRTPAGGPSRTGGPTLARCHRTRPTWAR